MRMWLDARLHAPQRSVRKCGARYYTQLVAVTAGLVCVAITIVTIMCVDAVRGTLLERHVSAAEWVAISLAMIAGTLGGYAGMRIIRGANSRSPRALLVAHAYMAVDSLERLSNAAALVEQECMPARAGMSDRDRGPVERVVGARLIDELARSPHSYMSLLPPDVVRHAIASYLSPEPPRTWLSLGGGDAHAHVGRLKLDEGGPSIYGAWFARETCPQTAMPVDYLTLVWERETHDAKEGTVRCALALRIAWPIVQSLDARTAYPFSRWHPQSSESRIYGQGRPGTFWAARVRDALDGRSAYVRCFRTANCDAFAPPLVRFSVQLPRVISDDVWTEARRHECRLEADEDGRAGRPAIYLQLRDGVFRIDLATQALVAQWTFADRQLVLAREMRTWGMTLVGDRVIVGATTTQRRHDGKVERPVWGVFVLCADTLQCIGGLSAALVGCSCPDQAKPDCRGRSPAPIDVCIASDGRLVLCHAECPCVAPLPHLTVPGCEYTTRALVLTAADVNWNACTATRLGHTLGAGVSDRVTLTHTAQVCGAVFGGIRALMCPDGGVLTIDAEGYMTRMWGPPAAAAAAE
jgi:hypothetical protein